jgi:hypothetical protein
MRQIRVEWSVDCALRSVSGPRRTVIENSVCLGPNHPPEQANLQPGAHVVGNPQVRQGARSRVPQVSILEKYR